MSLPIINQAKCIWLTGLSGAGKTTIAHALHERLHELNLASVILDGDILRKGLNKNLGFTDDDRKENIRRAAEMAKIILESRSFVICAFISPTIKIRQLAKQIIGNNNYLEVYVDTPIDVCIKRDTKGLYKKAMNGELKSFVGIDKNYEAPVNPDIKIETLNQNIKENVCKIINLLCL
jgi:adenylylsulfate kinase